MEHVDRGIAITAKTALPSLLTGVALLLGIILLAWGTDPARATPSGPDPMVGLPPLLTGAVLLLLAGLGWHGQRRLHAMGRERSLALEHLAEARSHSERLRLQAGETAAQNQTLLKERDSARHELAELHRLQDHYGALLPGAFLALSEQGEVRQVVGQVGPFFGVEGERLPGTRLEQWIAPESRSACRTFLDEARRTGRAQEHRANLPCGPDARRQVSLHARFDPPSRTILLLLLDAEQITRHVTHPCAMHQHLFDGKDGEEPVIQALARIDRISAAQLEGTVEETRLAAHSIFANAMQVREEMDDMGRFLAETSSRFESFGFNLKQSSHDDDQALKVLADFMRSLEAQRQHERQRAQEVTSEVNALRRLAELVMDLSERSRMLALNARIAASRAGEMGKKFTVVAEEIGSLAIQTGTMARNIDAGISKAAESVESALLQRFDSAEARQEVARMQQVATQVEQLKQHFHFLLTFNEESIGKINALQGGVSGKVLGLIGQLQFQDIVRQRLEQVTGTLQRKQAFLEELHTCAMAGCHGRDLSELKVNSIMREYVMAQQRQVHATVTGETGKAPAMAGGEITLF